VQPPVPEFKYIAYKDYWVAIQDSLLSSLHSWQVDIHTKVTSMSFLKKPFRKLKEMNNGSSPDNTSTDSVPIKNEAGSDPVLSTTSDVDAKSPTNGSTTTGIRSIAFAFAPNGKTKTNGSSGTSTPERADSKRQSREILNQERKRRSMDKERLKAETKKRESMAKIEDERFIQEGPPELTKLYRPYSMNMSKRWNAEDRLLFKNINWEGSFNGQIRWQSLIISKS
jgi:hypothetical protein